FFFSSRRRHTRFSRDWSSDVCSSDLGKDPSPVEIINDIDGDLINFFRVVKNKPEAFIESFELALVSREEFNYLANLNPKTLDDRSEERRVGKECRTGERQDDCNYK